MVSRVELNYFPFSVLSEEGVDGAEASSIQEIFKPPCPTFPILVI